MCRRWVDTTILAHSYLPLLPGWWRRRWKSLCPMPRLPSVSMPGGWVPSRRCSPPQTGARPRRGEGLRRYPAGSGRSGHGAGSRHGRSPAHAPASPQSWQPLHSHRGAGAGGRQAPALSSQDPGVPRGRGPLPRAVRTELGPLSSTPAVPAGDGGGTQTPQQGAEGLLPPHRAVGLLPVWLTHPRALPPGHVGPSPIPLPPHTQGIGHRPPPA